MMTTGYNFEGYSIADYLGICSGECALGTGFLSSLGAGFADIFGTNSNMYSEKLRDAKNYALDQLCKEVQALGGNAIIGVDVDYTTFSSDIMGVIASGTAVRIEQNMSDPILPTITSQINYCNIFEPVKASSLQFYISGSKVSVSLDLIAMNSCKIDGVIANITVSTAFEENIECNDLHFFNFGSANRHHIISEHVEVNMPAYVINCIKSISVVIKKYLSDSTVYIVPNKEPKLIEVSNDKNSATRSLEELLEIVEPLQSVKEILAYFEGNPEDCPDPVLLNDLKNLTFMERAYGNMKDSAIQKIRNFFSSN